MVDSDESGAGTVLPSTAEFAEALREIVAVESPSADLAAVSACGDALSDLGSELLGTRPERVPASGAADALRWRLGPDAPGQRVVLLGHVDTVWPAGTLGTRPFTLAAGRVTGPGVFDMKAGLIQALFALRHVSGHDRGEMPPVTLLVTGDEEVGSAGSHAIIEDEARRAQAVLVLEGAAPGGALKHARKGWSRYTVHLAGRGAHAGLEPANGRNALTSLAALIPKLAEVASGEPGVTVTPTTARAGETANTVPDQASMSLDVRAATVEAQHAVDAAIRSLAGTDSAGVDVHVEGGPNRPPLEPGAAATLLDRARDGAGRLHQERPEAMAVGGVSDGNITGALGVPTLDGLGAVGGGPHAEHEWVDLQPTIDRIALIAALLSDLARWPITAGITSRQDHS